MDKACQRYYKTVKRLFPLHQHEEKKFLYYLKETLEHHSHQHTEMTYDDYVDTFGNPYDIVATYYEHIESEYVITQMKSRKIVKNVLLIFLIVFILTVTYFSVIYYQEYKEKLQHQIYYEETSIMDETP